MKVELLINEKKIISFGRFRGLKEDNYMAIKEHHALDVAKYIVNKVNSRGERITHLQIQKMLYYIQAKFLVEEGRVLFKEPIEAWKHGPVVSNVYSYYKRYTSMGIADTSQPNDEFTKKECYIIDSIIKKYGKVDGWDLVRQTHKENPWLNVYRNGLGRNSEIPIATIKRYFEGEKGKL